MIWIAEAYGFDAVSLCGYLAAVTIVGGRVVYQAP